MKSQTSYLQIFVRHVPAGAVSYCYNLWLEHNFLLKISEHRRTKLGDYRFLAKNGGTHQISVNGTLNPYAFLITYLHEVAHLVTFSGYKRQVKPHGSQWKKMFRELTLPVLNEEVFPRTILDALQRYLANPKASSCSDLQLMSALQTAGDDQSGKLLLDLTEGASFKLNGRIFIKGQIRRTRVVCEEPSTRKRYLVPVQAVVEELLNC